MSSTIPKLTLFPLYPGGPRIQASDGLSASSSFYTRPTDFTPAYGINIPPQTRPSTDTFELRSNQTLQSIPAGSAQAFTTPLAVDGNILGNLKRAAVPAVAPVTPNLYQDAVSLLTISDMNFTDLMAQPSFTMSGSGMGVKVTTDGAGNVDTIALSQNIRSANPRVLTNDANFNTPNLAEITFRATPGATVGLKGGLNPQAESIDNRSAQNDKTTLRSLSLQNELALRPQLNRLNQPDGIFQTAPQTDSLNSLQFGKNNPLNPIIQRLLQLQPQDIGLTVAGYDAGLGIEQSRQAAATQAGFDVASSNRFQDNLNSLKSATLEKGQVYHQAGVDPRMMDGRMPMAPSFPAPARTAAETGTRFASSDRFSTGSSGVDDTTSKKGSGGYIPFQLGSHTSGQSGGGMGQPSPFSSFGSGGSNAAPGQQQNQQHPRRRQPVTYFA